MERNLENTSDQDLMSIRTQLQTKMTEGEKHHRKTPLEPTTTADVVCNLPPIDAIPSGMGTVFTKCLADLSVSPPKESSIGEPTEFSMKVPQSIGCNVQVQLKSLVDPTCIVQASVKTSPVRADTYVVTYIPQVRGRHDLIVKVNEREITGSPFRVFVKIHPTRLGKPMHIIDGLNQPWGIAVNNNQQLVVAESGGRKITIMERDGKRVQEIQCDEFRYPRGVATGPDGAVYVTDSDAQCLFKFSKDGKLCKSVNIHDLFLQPLTINSMYLSVITMKLRYLIWTAMMWEPLILVTILNLKILQNTMATCMWGQMEREVLMYTSVLLVENIYVMSISRNVNTIEVYVLTDVVISM